MSIYAYKKLDRNNPDLPQVSVRIGPTRWGKTRCLDDTSAPGNQTIAPDHPGKLFDGCDGFNVICFDNV